MSVVVLCPSCEAVLTDPAPCECGLDPSILFSIRIAANRHTTQALQLAAEGKWARAAVMARESLRLQSKDNDLSAFIVLLSGLAGPLPIDDPVPQPSEVALPEPLRRFVSPVLKTVSGLRNLAVSGPDDPAEFSAEIREILANGVSAPWIERALSNSEKPPTRANRRGSRLFLLPLAAFMAGAVLTAVLFVALRPAAPVPQSQIPAEPSPSETAQEPDPEANAIPAADDRGQRTAETTIALQRDLIRRDWASVARHLRDLPDRNTRDALTDAIPASGARAIYLAGLSASRKGSYVQAATLLDAAVAVADSDVYFRDDALYYAARAYQRSERQDAAGRLYETLLREHPDSTYVSDARRFLGQLGFPAAAQGVTK